MTTNMDQVSIASLQGERTAVALNNKPLSIKFSDVGKFIDINLPKKTADDPYPEVNISYSGKDAEAIGEVNTSPDGKSFKIKVPVSEILEKASSGETHRIVITTATRNYAIPVKVDPSELPPEYKTSTASANQFYQGLFDRMAKSGKYEISALLVVMPRNSGTAKNNPENDPYYSGGHGALTVFSGSAGWEKVSEEKYPNRKDSLYSTNVFARALDPDHFTGAMKEEFEKLPPDIQQMIRERGTVRLSVQYYTDTLKGFDSLLNTMKGGEFGIVQTLGHRFISFREKIYQLGQKQGPAEQAPMAYFGNHCNSRTSDNVPLSQVFKIFAPYGTNDSLFPGAELNRVFLQSLITGDIDSLQQDLVGTYRDKVRPGVSQAAASSLFAETPASGYNPYLDPDKDGLPAFLDGDLNNPNPYHVTHDHIVMTTPNGLLKVPYSGALSQGVVDNALSREEFSSKVGIAGRSTGTTSPEKTVDTTE